MRSEGRKIEEEWQEKELGRKRGRRVRKTERMRKSVED